MRDHFKIGLSLLNQIVRLVFSLAEFSALFFENSQNWKPVALVQDVLSRELMKVDIYTAKHTLCQILLEGSILHH